MALVSSKPAPTPPRSDGGNHPFANQAGLAMLAVGLVFFLGTVADLATLWVAQRQPSIQWEFAALTSTAEGLPRLALAFGALYLALLLRKSESLSSYRFIGIGMLLTGLASALIGVLIGMDYLALARQVAPEAAAVFRSSVAKTLALALTYTAVLVPVGGWGLSRPKGLRRAKHAG
jgi:hypothetical protein